MTRILFAVVSYSKAKGKFGIMECVVCSTDDKKFT